MIQVPVSQLRIRWMDCTTGFYCPKCGEELFADHEDGPKQCECGVMYQLRAELIVTKPSEDK